ncbi:MAG: DUF1015 domain-containing protein [Gammaproteobacteria bacterium]|jgi:uncharacterized protein (DUF1015 family)|nr:DUF1015 domain-containing protein [Gammaproteobacteria bacterium]
MKITAFKGLRPVKEKVEKIASRPYDVLNSEEAREEAKDNPDSFLNVVKPEITLPMDIDPYSAQVYQAGKKNFEQLLEQGTFFKDEKDCLYIYELVMDGRSQTGIVACAAVEDYLNDHIKKHELTRPDKEADRKNHVRVSMINAEPVFFAYKAVEKLDCIVEQIKSDDAEYSFIADDGVEHKLWVVKDDKLKNDIVNEFEKMPATYVADGHHRTAAAALVGNELKNENPTHVGSEEYNYFLAVHFPDNQLEIIDYNRVVKDLNGLDVESFLEAVSASFEVQKTGEQVSKPAYLHEIGMYLQGDWYSLTANVGTYDDNDPIGVLDVTILSNQILEPILNIHDLRTDKRIEFIGGIRGMEELERRVDSGEMAVAFAMYPVSMKQLMDIADGGLIMPPKVTWFEPKLRSGLVVHSLEN